MVMPPPPHTHIPQGQLSPGSHLGCLLLSDAAERIIPRLPSHLRYNAVRLHRRVCHEGRGVLRVLLLQLRGREWQADKVCEFQAAALVCMQCETSGSSVALTKGSSLHAQHRGCWHKDLQL